MSKNDGQVLMEGVRIIFRNFAGKEGPYNSAGDRNFGVVLDPETARVMANDGWNVKLLAAREEDEDDTPWLPVSIRFDVLPPNVAMVTSRGRTQLTESEVEMLDWADISNVDMIVRPFNWEVNGKTGIKAYVKSLYVTIEEDELQRRYADIPEAADE